MTSGVIVRLRPCDASPSMRDPIKGANSTRKDSSRLFIDTAWSFQLEQLARG
jgi:hypothetical protein